MSAHTAAGRHHSHTPIKQRAGRNALRQYSMGSTASPASVSTMATPQQSQDALTHSKKCCLRHMPAAAHTTKTPPKWRHPRTTPTRGRESAAVANDFFASYTKSAGLSSSSPSVIESSSAPPIRVSTHSVSVFPGGGITSQKLNDRQHDHCPIRTYNGMANNSSQFGSLLTTPLPYSQPNLPYPPQNRKLHRPANKCDETSKFVRAFVQTDPSSSGRVEVMTTRRAGAAHVDCNVTDYDLYKCHNSKQLRSGQRPAENLQMGVCLPFHGTEREYRCGKGASNMRPRGTIQNTQGFSVGHARSVPPCRQREIHVSGDRSRNFSGDLGHLKKKIVAPWTNGSKIY